jgi:Flp pilus assembly protein TadG
MARKSAQIITSKTARRQQRGAALFELALVLPLMTFVAYGVVNFGIALKEKQLIVEAARYGARRAAAEGIPYCVQASTQISFEKCNQVLSNPYSEAADDVLDSGAFYACQSIESAGLVTEQWQVSAELEYEGFKPTVSVRVQRAVPGQIFVKALAGDIFPSTKGVFVTQKGCDVKNAS